MCSMLLERARALKLYGLMAHWDEVSDSHGCNSLLLGKTLPFRA